MELLTLMSSIHIRVYTFNQIIVTQQFSIFSSFFVQSFVFNSFVLDRFNFPEECKARLTSIEAIWVSAQFPELTECILEFDVVHIVEVFG